MPSLSGCAAANARRGNFAHYPRGVRARSEPFAFAARSLLCAPRYMEERAASRTCCRRRTASARLAGKSRKLAEENKRPLIDGLDETALEQPVGPSKGPLENLRQWESL